MPADFALTNLTNHFLIAMPGLQDEMFSRSVVYVCEHSERGTLGLVINKPADMLLKCGQAVRGRLCLNHDHPRRAGNDHLQRRS